MRIKLHLKPVRDKQALIFNYQYAIQAWIYGLLARSDKDYSQFLHDEGYLIGDSKKSFKHFTFSSLQLGRTKPIQKGDKHIELSLDTIFLTLSFCIDSAAKAFMIGLFQSQELSLFNQDYKADFIVERVESLQMPALHFNHSQTVTKIFEVDSPMVLAEEKNGITEYISPIDSRYERLFSINLWDKYRSLETTKSFDLDPNLIQSIIQWKLVSNPENIKRKGLIVKEGKGKQQIKIIGFENIRFEVTAPENVLAVGYLGGFGKYCAMGCGFTNIVTEE